MGGGYIEEARKNHVKKKVEEALRSKMKAKALKECDELTSKYAQCASGRTFSVIWQCRRQANDLNICLKQLSVSSSLPFFIYFLVSILMLLYAFLSDLYIF